MPWEADIPIEDQAAQQEDEPDEASASDGASQVILGVGRTCRHEHMTGRGIIAIGIVGILGFAWPLSASKRAIPPTVAQLAGVWTGWESDSITFFRVDLSADGTGYLAASFLGGPAVLSRITRWSLSGWRVTMQTTPVDVHPNDVMAMSGNVVVRKLELDIVGGRNEWRQHITLHKDDQAHLARARVDERMQALK